MGVLNIPEPLWHSVILVRDRTAFERWLSDPTNNECPSFFYLSKINNGKYEELLTGEEIRRLTEGGYRQVKIGLNCIIY
jgi:hypothetical protein